MASISNTYIYIYIIYIIEYIIIVPDTFSSKLPGAALVLKASSWATSLQGTPAGDTMVTARFDSGVRMTSLLEELRVDAQKVSSIKA